MVPIMVERTELPVVHRPTPIAGSSICERYGLFRDDLCSEEV